MKTDIFCRVCLRTDRKLLAVSYTISDFHDELCDYSADCGNPKYCTECEHLLRKQYNFKARCQKANKILKTWRKAADTKKKPADLLHTLLPPSFLGHWTPKNNGIFEFVHEDTGSESNLESGEITLQNENVKLETANGAERVLPSQDSNVYERVRPSQDSMNVYKKLPVFNDNLDHTEKSKYIEIEFNDLNVKEELSDDGSDDDDIKLKYLKYSVSVSNEHSNIKDREEQIGTLKKKSLIEGDVSMSDDLICDDDTENFEDCKTQKHKMAVAKTKKKSTEKKSKNNKSGKKHMTKKEIRARLDFLKRKMNGERISSNKLSFSKERLIEEIRNKFESCGELVGNNGRTIDKQFIINCLDGKVPECVMRRLWPACHGKKSFQLRAISIFTSIQNKYKDDHKFESVFDIEYLTTEQELADEFQKRKTYECYINAEYKCEICYQGFKHEKTHEYHRLKCHDENAGDIICSICNVRHRTKKLLNAHISTSHNAIFKCKLCPLITYYRISMANHYEQHQGTQYACEICGQSYTSRSSYLNHRGLSHPTHHVCTLCGRSLYSEKALKSHKTRMHKDHTPGVCDINCSKCELAFPSQDAYLKHLRTAHRGQVSYRMLAGLKKARKTPKKYKMTCRVCNAVGNHFGWLCFHFRAKHPTLDIAVVYADKRNHLCDICGKGYSSPLFLRDHMNTHTGAHPYVCDACPKRFQSLVSLRGHRSMHQPPSKTCPHCDKKFRKSSNLSNHIRSHIQDRRYKCNICGKGFLHRSTLNEHVKGVHYHVRRVRKKGVTESGPKKTALSTEVGGD